MGRRNTRKVIGWLLLALSLLLVVTGLGITWWRTVEAASLGLLTKSLALRLHALLWIPFLAVLAAHLILSCGAGIPRRDCSPGRKE